MSLPSIPDDVFEEFIIPYLTMKDIGNLTQVSPLYKRLCDTNLTWKRFYMDSIPDKWKTNDNSIHFGGKYFGVRVLLKMNNKIKEKTIYSQNYQNSIKELENIGYEVTILPSDPLDCSHQYYDVSTLKCNCYPKGFIPPTWESIRLQNEPFELRGYNMGIKNGKKKLKAFTREKWIQFNKENGFSTKNLCQNPKHYILDTLDIPDKCMNYKNYKKVVLRKIYTKEKRKIAPYTRELNNLNNEIFRAKKIMKQMEINKGDILERKSKHERFIQNLLK